MRLIGQIPGGAFYADVGRNRLVCVHSDGTLSKPTPLSTWRGINGVYIDPVTDWDGAALALERLTEAGYA